MKFVDKIILKKSIKDSKHVVRSSTKKVKPRQTRLKLPKNWIHGRLR